VHPRASRVSGCGEMGRDQGPLGVGEVGLVCSSHAWQSTELLLTTPFQTVSTASCSEVGPWPRGRTKAYSEGTSVKEIDTVGHDVPKSKVT
jgi:hypothetical protein